MPPQSPKGKLEITNNELKIKNKEEDFVPNILQFQSLRYFL